ncbi:hypothetical protein CC78DRAFT_536416 [Lojkania enalia]|uniref:Uncharacterized protein n=1 Tax=Lojkania enalia TaxID=147567 RepID=A0A9P4K6M4_9PLEO|nr:hypothetical protein CC78DRAFT_536416 [Didymosphaeria enalia]
MAGKRKRDVQESPVSTSSFASSTPEAPSPSNLPQGESMELDTPSARPVLSGSWEFHAARLAAEVDSRTRKRHRDDKPNERAIAERTLTMLFDAQRSNPDAKPMMSEDKEPAQQDMVGQKSILDYFTKVPQEGMQRQQDVEMEVDGRQ